MQYNALPLLNESFVIFGSEWKFKSKLDKLTEYANQGKKTTVRGLQDTEFRKDLNANSRPKQNPAILRRRGPKTRTTYKHNILQ